MFVSRTLLRAVGFVRIRQSMIDARASVNGARSCRCVCSVERERGTRNIGIVAHIDAGKTTTTERMLFYAGYSRFMGDVDDGDTVMDYMEQERDRGITITSAAITFYWNQYRINLIDTPGHVDFTMEVERCLRVLDGVVTVLDATAGVEAQSYTVWRQADRYHVPRIIYLNKMDRPNASVQLCLASVREKLRSKPLLTQVPILHDGNFVGVVDLLTMEKVEWSLNKDPLGWAFSRVSLKDGDLWEQCVLSRIQLTEDLADLDDDVADLVLAGDDDTMEKVPASQLSHALRRVTLAQKAVPVLCGSSYKNVAVQLLMDAVIKYLPSPDDVSHSFVAHYSGNLCALVFKILHDKFKGQLTFIRIYSGSLKEGQSIYNVNRGASEKVLKILTAFANEFQEVSCATAGNIVVVTGLRNFVTGNTITSSATVASAAAKRANTETRPSAVLAGVPVPPPVYFCAIEAASLAHQKPLELALQQLQVEDPSFGVRVDNDTGQTIVSGMGELHMEIVRDRLLREHKVEAELGTLQVAYREVLDGSSQMEHVLDRQLGGSKQRVVLRLSLEQQPEEHSYTGLKMGHSRDNQENLAKLRPDHLRAIENGIHMALNHGPLIGYPITNALLKLQFCEVGPRTFEAMISACASQCVTHLIGTAGVRLAEPYMQLEIVSNERHTSGILADLSPRRAQIVDVQGRMDVRVIRVVAPLAELTGYSTALRTITSGMATLSIELHEYKLMTLHEQQNAIQEVKGFL